MIGNIISGAISLRQNKEASERAKEMFEQQIAQQEKAAALWEALDMPEYSDLDPTELSSAQWEELLGSDVYQDLLGGGIGEDLRSGRDLSFRGADTRLNKDRFNISEDQMTRDMQVDALRSIADIADDGMDAQAMANLARAEEMQAQTNRANREAILQDMAMRGAGGSGAELIAQLQGQKSAAEGRRALQMQALADAEGRRMQALGMQGNLASGLRGQDFGNQMAMAQGRAGIDQAQVQANLAGQQNQLAYQQNLMAADRNQLAAQQAAQQNALAARQAQTGMQMNALGQMSDIDRYNASVRDHAQQYNNQLRNQAYQDQLAKTSGQSNALTGLGGVYGQQGGLATQQAEAARQRGAAHAQAETETASNIISNIFSMGG